MELIGACEVKLLAILLPVESVDQGAKDALAIALDHLESIRREAIEATGWEPGDDQ